MFAAINFDRFPDSMPIFSYATWVPPAHMLSSRYVRFCMILLLVLNMLNTLVFCAYAMALYFYRNDK